MPNKSVSFKNSGINLKLLMLSIITILYWLTAKSLNVYNYSFIGALFELLRLPMLGFVFFGPLISILLFVKDKYRLRSIAIYIAVLQMVALYILILFKSKT